MESRPYASPRSRETLGQGGLLARPLKTASLPDAVELKLVSIAKRPMLLPGFSAGGKLSIAAGLCAMSLGLIGSKLVTAFAASTRCAYRY